MTGYGGEKERDRMVHVIWKKAKLERSRLNWVAFLSPDVHSDVQAWVAASGQF